ncbi:unnamed protein product [Diamesa tonsa]
MSDLVTPKENSLFSWILKTVLLPVTFPILIYNLYEYIKSRKLRNSLPGKVVLITGASSGLGEALAHVFYIAGCKVVLAARRTDELERVKKDLLQSHSTVTTHPPIVLSLDLTELNDLPGKVKQILDIHGHIDILINNGGVSVRSDVVSTQIDVDIKIMLVNYFGTAALTKAVLPSMIARKEGRIVCISSVQGKFAIPQRSAYSASKHALQAFCDSLRAEMDEHNVKVTLVSPGYINTPLSMNALTGNGSTYGKVDPATAAGVDPLKLSEQILESVLSDKKDVVSASFTAYAAIWIRFLCPPFYFWLMAQRARKFSKSTKKSE